MINEENNSEFSEMSEFSENLPSERKFMYNDENE